MDTTWQEAIDDFLHFVGAELAQKSIAAIGCQLRQLRVYAEGRELTLQAFNSRHWRSYVCDRCKAVSQRTVYADFQHARRFFRYCRRQRFVSVDPMKDYVGKCPRRPDPGFIPEPPDLRAVMEAVHTKHDPAENARARFIRQDLNDGFAVRDHAIICMLIGTAARIHEILALRYTDLDRERRTVLLTKTKGNKPRTVPIEEGLLAHIEPWLNKRDKLERAWQAEKRRAAEAARKLERARDPDERRALERAARLSFELSDTLFVTRYGDAMRPDAFSKQFAAYVAFCGVKKFTLHKLRHFTLSALSHIDMPSAQNIAGHEHISTTQIYSHTKLDHMRALVDKAQPLAQVFLNVRTEARKNSRPTVF